MQTHLLNESLASLLQDPADPLPAATGLKPLPLDELSRRITNLPHASLTRDAPKKMSLAGAQHKMLVVMQDGALFEPLPGTPSTHILKPEHQSGDYPASVMNEFFSMRLAKAVGLDVPAVQRLYVPQPVYLVERFDRLRGAGTEDITRRHVIDTCQLLGKARRLAQASAVARFFRRRDPPATGRAACRDRADGAATGGLNRHAAGLNPPPRATPCPAPRA